MLDMVVVGGYLLCWGWGGVMAKALVSENYICNMACTMYINRNQLSYTMGQYLQYNYHHTNFQDTSMQLIKLMFSMQPYINQTRRNNKYQIMVELSWAEF